LEDKKLIISKRGRRGKEARQRQRGKAKGSKVRQG